MKLMRFIWSVPDRLAGAGETPIRIGIEIKAIALELIKGRTT